MKRDWQIIKEILFKFRDDTISEYIQCILNVASSSRRNMILEHIELMTQDGLVQGIGILPSSSELECTMMCPRLTSLGHSVAEYLSMHSLEKIKYIASKRNLPITTEMIKSFMTLSDKE